MKTAELIGFDEIDAETIEMIKEPIEALLERYYKIFGKGTINEFKIILDKLGPEDAARFEIKATLNTKFGLFYTVEEGYKIKEMIDEIVKELDRIILEKKEKLKAKRETPANP